MPSVAKLDEWTSASASSTLTKAVSAGNRRMALVIVATRLGGSTNAIVQSVDYGGEKMINPTGWARTSAGGAVRIHISGWYLREADIALRSNNVITPTYDNTPSESIIACATFSGVNQRARPFLERAGALTALSTPNPFTTIDVTVNPESYAVGAVCAVPNTTVTWHSDLTERIDTTDNLLTLSIADGFNTSGGLLQVEGTFASQNRAAGLSCEINNRFLRRVEDHIDGKVCECGHGRTDHGLSINVSRVGTFLDHHCEECECEQWIEDTG